VNCSLALTGVSALPMLIIAVVLLVLGAVAVLIARRRKSSLAVLAVVLLALSLGGVSVVATPGAAQAASACSPAHHHAATPPVTTPATTVPDLTDTISADNTEIGAVQATTEHLTVTVSEVAGVATAGSIVILIPTNALLPTGALSAPSYDPTATVDVNNSPVDNSLFVFSDTANPGYYTFTASSTVIPANGTLAFSFTVDYTSGGATG
jgi:hypothetical protein